MRAGRWLGVVLLGWARTVGAQSYAVTLTLPNPAPGRDGGFGLALAASGSSIVVGVPLDDTAGSDAGAVYVVDGATGSLIHALSSPTPVRSGLFGRAVGVAGTDLAVGAPAEGNPPAAGLVHLFDATAGTLLGTLGNPTPDANDVFGFSVAAVRGALAVGAPLDDGTGADAGAVHLFGKAIGHKGFRFRSKPPTNEGVSGLSLRAGHVAHIVASGHGADLALPALPLTPPLVLQLKSTDGACWDARFTAPRVNAGGRLRAKAG